jgi:hypothetical protein
MAPMRASAQMDYSEGKRLAIAVIPNRAVPSLSRDTK